MAKKWDDVVANPEFQKLSSADKRAARDQYFSEVVAPNIPDYDVGTAYLQFANYSDPTLTEAPTTGAAVRHTLERAALPTVGGFSGAELAALAVAPITVPMAATGAGALPAAVIEALAAGAGALGGASLFGAGQEKYLEAHPELAKKLGLDEQTRAIEEELHPTAVKATELGANLLAVRPTVSGVKALAGFGEAEAAKAAREGIELTEKEAVKQARTKAAVNAALFGGLDVGQQLVSDRPFDTTQALENVALGALSQKETALGRLAGAPGRAVGRLFKREAAAEGAKAGEAAGEAAGQEADETAVRRAKVLHAMDEIGVPSKANLRDATGLSDLEVQAELNSLKNEGVVTYSGSQKGWVVTDPEKAETAKAAWTRPQAKAEPGEQEQLPLVGGEAQMDMFGAPKVEEAPPTEYQPRNAYQQEMDLTPPEQGTLPLTKPVETTGQQEMFGAVEPIEPGGKLPETPVVEPEPRQQGVQYGFDLPGTPISELAPRDRLLRAFKISKVHTFDELRKVARVPMLEAMEEFSKLRNEGIVKFDESTGKYELTQTGEKRATDTGAEPTGAGRGAELPVSERDTGEPGAIQLELGGMEPAGRPAVGAAGGEGKGEGALKSAAPRVDSIEGIAVGPGGRIRPKVILEDTPLHHETNASGLTDLLRKDNDFDVNRVFVSDDPTLAIGQGDNTGVRVEFRPNSLSGAENPKPGTGIIGGREYVTDIIAPKAVEKVTVENPKTLGPISAQAKRVLSSEFERVDNPDGSVTFNRKSKAAAPAEAPKIEPPKSEATKPTQAPVVEPAKPTEAPPAEAAKPAEAPKVEAKEEPKKEPEAVKEDVLKDDNPLDSKARYSKTPKEQQASDKRAVEKLGNAHNALPVVTQRVVDNTANALSNVPSSVRRGAFAFKNIHNLANMYRKYTGALDTLWEHMNANGAKLQAREKIIRDNLHKWNKVMSKYSANERDRLYQIMHDTTVDQIEVLNYKDAGKGIDWKVSPSDKASATYKAFHAIKDQAVKDMYRDMRIAYHDYINEVEGEIKKYVTPNEWQKLMAQYNMKRLSVYLPLFRSGDRFLRYIDKNGVDIARSFESELQRNQAIKEAIAGGANPDSVHVYNKISDMTAGIPPTGFYGKMVGILKKGKVKQEVLDKLFEAYMDHMPAKSVLQLARKREGTAGYINDPLRSYANVANGYARRLGNMESFPKYDKALEQLKIDLFKSKLDPNVASDIISNVQSKIGFLKDPSPSNLADKAAYGSYLLHLGGNVSTGIVNLFDTPTMTMGRIAGIGGSLSDAFSALTKASFHYFNRAGAPAEIKSILDRATREGVLGEHRISDLAEFKKYGSDYVGLKAKVDGALSYVLSKTDKFNREVALTAAYDVAKKKFAKEGLSGDALTEAAYKEAKRAVYDVHTSLYSQTMPNIMHNDLARVALTFKRYSINRINMLTDALREATAGESMQVKKLARAQLLGYFGMAYLVSGVQGMPLVGWLETLASATNGMFGDDDTPFDPEDALKHYVGEASFHGPVNYLLNLDIASRTGWDGMLWRDDPKRLAEVGPAAYTVEHLLGPTYSYMVGVPQALKTIGEGNLERGAEQLSPAVLRNFMKAWRYGTQGATTKDGVPIVNDVNAWNTFMQVWGFSPADITEARAEASAMKEGERQINLRRQSLLDRAVITRMSQDVDGFRRVQQEIVAFNKKYPKDAIRPQSVNTSIIRRRQNMAQSVNGVTINKKLRSAIEKQHEEE